MRDHPSPWVFSKFGKATRFKPKVPEKLGFQKMGGGGRRISTHPEGGGEGGGEGGRGGGEGGGGGGEEEHPSEEEEVGHKEAEAQLLSAVQNAHNTHPAPKVSCFGVKIKFPQ